MQTKKKKTAGRQCRFRLICALLFMGMTGALGAQDNNKDWANLERYAQSNRTVMTLPQEQRRAVLLGNSITDNWARMRPQFFTDNGYVGRGIGGQTSYQFLVRFREDVINLHPQVVVINAGTNDVAENTGPYDEDRTMGNIISMAELAKANGIKVILSSVLPAAAFGWNKSVADAPAKIASLNRRIASYAKEHGLTYVDYFSALVAADGKSLRDDYGRDGVHPTDAGYEVMEPLVKQAIESCLAKD